MRPFVLLTLAFSLTTLTTVGEAQGKGDPPRRPPPESHRAELEQQFRQQNEQMIRDRLKLNDEQVKQLRALDARFGPRRGALFQEWRSIQRELRKEVDRGDAADQKRVTQLMKQSSDLRKQTFALMDEEHKALGAFLTPVQTAQYISLQAQLREKVQRKANRGGKPSGEDGRGNGPGGHKRIDPPRPPSIQ